MTKSGNTEPSPAPWTPGALGALTGFSVATGAAIPTWIALQAVTTSGWTVVAAAAAGIAPGVNAAIATMSILKKRLAPPKDPEPAEPAAPAE